MKSIHILSQKLISFVQFLVVIKNKLEYDTDAFAMARFEK